MGVAVEIVACSGVGNKAVVATVVTVATTSEAVADSSYF